MKVLLLLFRLIVGLVFMFSGFVKAVDPLGSCYKFTDYFNLAFDMPALAQFSLPLAFILSALEFTTGVMLVFKLKPRWAAWMSLAFMIEFTPLTFYIAWTNPVHDCGCFGDAVVLENWPTFWKNVILLTMVIFIVILRKRMDNPLDDRAELGIAVAVFCIALVFQHMMLRHLPIFDFRPYKKGNNIAEKMVLPADAKTDKWKTIVTYQNSVTNEIKDFEVDDIPYEDTTWIWKDSKSILVEKGDVPEIHDLTMCDTAGTDFTQRVLNFDKPVLLVVTHKIEKSDNDGLNKLKEIQEYAIKKDYIMIGLTSSNWETINEMKDIKGLNFPYLQTDDITLKTMIRANPGIMKLEKGTVTGKWNFRDFKTNKDY